MMKMNTGKKKKIRPYILEWKPTRSMKKKSETRHQNNKTDGASSIVLASSTA